MHAYIYLYMYTYHECHVWWSYEMVMYDHCVRWPYMIIIYDHHMWYSYTTMIYDGISWSYVMRTDDPYIWSSYVIPYLIIICGGHMWSPCVAIISDDLMWWGHTGSPYMWPYCCSMRFQISALQAHAPCSVSASAIKVCAWSIDYRMKCRCYPDGSNAANGNPKRASGRSGNDNSP